ncbi:hypothetical protein CRE_23030 [Caenorhabditis remanei]|uniref:Uncharacterized protein n=1 Tax=Caenorhabditis remanei TaxID=31234 RepID=E3N4F9_CAERE|nr:hypothetical protein CRE_23030 [Caenorhabditis remanei]
MCNSDKNEEERMNHMKREILEQEKTWMDQYSKMEATVGDLDVKKDESFQTLARQLRAENEKLKDELAQKNRRTILHMISS